MKFKVDENLITVAAAKGNPDVDSVSRELCDAFIDAGMLEMSPDNFNSSVLQATGPQYVSDVCAVLAGYLYNDETHTVPAGVFDAFCRLQIISEGCPRCGGKPEFVETNGHELHDGDRYTPNSYVIDEYIYRCRECGEIIKSENEL